MKQKSDWSPGDYLKFEAERSRPAMDLLARIAGLEMKQIFDLGCGPGNSTALLRAAFPAAAVTGIDSSPAMLKRAAADVRDASFVHADLADWVAPAETDLLFSNATFQWVSQHAEVMSRLLRGLKQGGVMAVQMPDNLNEPSHVAMRQAAEDERWASLTAAAAASREKLLDARGYHDLLSPHCRSIDIWGTTYFHRLNDHQAIVDFVSSTGLRPFLDALNPAQHDSYRTVYLDLIRAHYRQQADGSVLLAFPRLFMVAVR